MSFEDYKKAQKLGQKSYREHMSAGKYPYLPSLMEMLPAGMVLRESKLGLVNIPLEFISGTYTAGRQNAFAPNFMPLLETGTEFATKWDTLSTAHVEEGIHDAIIAYEYRNHFYVQEGNKRVSVLKFYGAVSVPGEVIRILPPKNDEIENVIYYEYIAFYECSQVNYLYFTKKGSYAKLTELMGIEPGRKWTDEEKEYLYSFYYRFKTVYEGKGGNKLAGTVGDALLIYIELMGYEEVKNHIPAEIKEDLTKIWSEFGVRSTAKVELIMNPVEQSEGLMENINKILPISFGPKKIRAAFVHDKTGETSAWTYAHELGRMYLEEVFKDQIETNVYTNALSNPHEIIEKAIEDGNKVIFTTTPQLNEASLKAAIEHPDVKILNCSLNISHSYIRTYYVRLYEAKVLTGIIAGALADNNRIGYIADYPIAGMVANINAFALGAQLSNPRAKIYLKWSSIESSEPIKELMDEGVTVCSGQDMIRPDDSKRVFGVNIIENGKLENIATAVTDWGKLYERIIKVALNSGSKGDKAPKSLNYWWGIDAGVVDIICSTKLGNGTRRLIDLVRKNIAEGIFVPFEGELYAQDGVCIQKEGTLTPEEIVSMDWLAENIEGCIPKLSELKPEARAVAVLQSIEKTKDQ